MMTEIPIFYHHTAFLDKGQFLMTLKMPVGQLCSFPTVYRLLIKKSLFNSFWGISFLIKQDFGGKASIFKNMF